jgi:hypothetical protein
LETTPLQHKVVEGNFAEYVAEKTIEYMPTINDAVRLASFCSLLRHFNVDRRECIDDLYTVLAYVLKNAPAQYFEGAAVLASQRSQHPDVLIDVFGEDGFRTIIEYINSSACNKKLLAELVVDIMEAEDFTREARRVIIKILPKLTCEQVKALIIASLVVPPGDRSVGKG